MKCLLLSLLAILSFCASANAITGTFGAALGDSTSSTTAQELHNIVCGGVYTAPVTCIADSMRIFVWTQAGNAWIRALVYDYDGQLISAGDSTDVNTSNADKGAVLPLPGTDTLWGGQSYLLAAWANLGTASLCRLGHENLGTDPEAHSKWTETNTWVTTPPTSIDAPIVVADYKVTVTLWYTELTDFTTIEFNDTLSIDDGSMYKFMSSTVYNDTTSYLGDMFSSLFTSWWMLTAGLDSAIGTGQEIVHTVIKIYAKSGGGSTEQVYSIDGKLPVEGEITFDDYKTSTAWASGGGDYVNVKFAEKAIIGINRWADFVFNDSGLAFMQEILDGTRTNYGFNIRPDAGGQIITYWASETQRFTSDSAKSTRMYVTYKAVAAGSTGPPNSIHSPSGPGVLHSPLGRSKLHTP